MQITTILNHIDNGHMALPEFQRGFVWNRDQVRGLFDSLYRRHPVGGLLVWVTESRTAVHRGDSTLAPGVVKLLLDGQQRMTSLYGIMRGNPPRFFDGNPAVLTGLQFHLDSETFEYWQPVKMRDDPLWIDVTELMKMGVDGLGTYIARFSQDPELAPRIGEFAGRLSQLLGIGNINLHIEEVTGSDKSLDIVVDIFNRVNSGGTKLSKGDLALAKICADWPEARDEMRRKISQWDEAGFDFNLDWFLRSINTVLTGEAKFQYLHEKNAEEIQSAFHRANKHIDSCLNMISSRLGLDHNQVFFGRFAVPVMVRYLEIHQGPLTQTVRDKLLFWYMHAAMWGRFSGSTESYIDQDLGALEGPDGGVDRLLDQLRLWHGSLRIEPAHFSGWSLGARFYPVLYFLTRTGKSRDLGNEYLELTKHLLGKMNRLEVHHIFPKAQLYKYEREQFGRSDANALANFCFLTKQANLEILDRLPEDYFEEVEANAPGALASQWIPMDRALWKIENYRAFLAVRQELLAREANARLEELLHGDSRWTEGEPVSIPVMAPVPGGITSEEEEKHLEALNTWVEHQKLPRGQISFDYADPETGAQRAVFDLAWPDGIQSELSQPVAVLLGEGAEVLAIASQAGYQCFTTIQDFRHYVQTKILVSGGAA